MHRQGILFTGLIRDPLELEILPGRSGSRWLASLYALRSRLLETLDRLYGDNGADGAVLKAMLLGDDNWLDRATERAFQDSGTYHVLVVSGWNVWALALPLLLVVTRLRFPRWLGTMLVAGTVVGFALLAHGGASVARAALMLLLFLVARLFYRQNVLLNSVAAAALILLLLHPSDLRDSGFQLSFFAVLVLAAIALPLVEWTALPYRQALEHLLQGNPFLEQAPDSRADLVQAEVDSGLQIQKDRFALQLPEHNVIVDSNRVPQSEPLVRHQALTMMICLPTSRGSPIIEQALSRTGNSLWASSPPLARIVTCSTNTPPNFAEAGWAAFPRG
jgi:hypothetical protein